MKYTQISLDKVYQGISEKIIASLMHQERPTLVVAGGSTFGPVYKLLSTVCRGSIDWSTVSIYFGDERCVPPNDSRSNYRFFQENFLSNFKEDELPQVYRIHGERDPHEAALEYQSLLPDRFDVVLLGVGDDGHTASVFPGTPEPSPGERVIVTIPEKEPYVTRISLTVDALNFSDHIFVLTTGEGKKSVVEDIRNNSHPEYPVMRLADQAELFFALPS